MKELYWIVIIIAVIAIGIYLWKPWIPERYKDPLYCDEGVGCIYEWDDCMNEYHYTGSDDRWLLLGVACECDVESNRCVRSVYKPLYGLRSFCRGDAICFNGTVTDVIDGDTLDANNIPIRLALVDAKELSEEGGDEARDFTLGVCPVGADVIVDEDDNQIERSYDRIVGVVYCNGINLNAALIESGYGVLDNRFCEVSEFADEEWTGC